MTGIAFAGITGILGMRTTAIRDWLPLAFIPLAYWQTGQFVLPLNEWFQSKLESFDRKYLRSDPPSIGELNSVRQHVDGVFEGLEVDTPVLGVAVGGSATSLRRLVGAVLEHETLERGIRVLASNSIDEVARRFELEPERVRLLPAGILILEAAADRLGVPLQIGRGGLREGVVLEMMAAQAAPAGQKEAI